MKTTSAIKSWLSKHDLPEDIWPRILSNLPVKTLLRFRCVSKFWLSSIDHPDFVHSHINQSNNRLHETRLFVAEKHLRRYCIVKCGRDEFVESSQVATFFDRKWRIVCYMDGLFLLQCKSLYQTESLMLWNPSIRRARILPPSPKKNEAINVDLGLGFDPLIKDYKFVRLLHDDGPRKQLVVYTVGAGSWKTIPFHGKGMLDWCWQVVDASYGRKSVCFRGFLCIILWELKSRTQELVSFDLSKEVFASTCLPVNCHSKCSSTLVEDGGFSLRMIGFSSIAPYNELISMWMLESSYFVDMSSMSLWTKIYTFAPSLPSPSIYDLKLCDFWGPAVLYLKLLGDMVFGTWPGQLITYNIQTHGWKTLLKDVGGIEQVDRIWKYKESLLLFNGSFDKLSKQDLIIL